MHVCVGVRGERGVVGIKWKMPWSGPSKHTLPEMVAFLHSERRLVRDKLYMKWWERQRIHQAVNSSGTVFLSTLIPYNTVLVAGTLHKLKQWLRKRFQKVSATYTRQSKPRKRKRIKKSHRNNSRFDSWSLSSKDISVFYLCHVHLTFLLSITEYCQLTMCAYIFFGVYIVKVCITDKMLSRKWTILQYWITSNSSYISLV